MKLLGKIILGSVLGVGSFFAFKVFRTKKVGDNLDIKIVNPRIHKITGNPFTGGIEVRTDIELQNPTKGEMSLTQPFVQILSKGMPLFSSKVSSHEFTIKPLSKNKLKPLAIKIKWGKILNFLIRGKFKFPKNATLLEKVKYILEDYQRILHEMELETKYSTHANGIFYKEQEKIEI